MESRFRNYASLWEAIRVLLSPEPAGDVRLFK
jgi:hypothetical protein